MEACVVDGALFASILPKLRAASVLNAMQKLEFAYDGKSRRLQKKVYEWDTDRWALTTDQRFVYFKLHHCHKGWSVDDMSPFHSGMNHWQRQWLSDRLHKKTTPPKHSTPIPPAPIRKPKAKRTKPRPSGRLKVDLAIYVIPKGLNGVSTVPGAGDATPLGLEIILRDNDSG